MTAHRCGVFTGNGNKIQNIKELRSQLSTINNIRESLYTAAIKGDWQSANNICKKNPRVANK